MTYCFVLKEDGAPSFEGELGTDETARLSGDPNGETIDDEKLETFIEDKAEPEVNAYCRKHYDVPFAVDAVPKEIKSRTMDVAIFYSYGTKPSERIRVRYEDAIKFLKEVANGNIVLDVETEIAVSAVKPETTFKSNARLFTRDA